VIEHLPSKHEALNSNPVPQKKRKRKINEQLNVSSLIIKSWGIVDNG
jgi:hypothetical protein